MTEKSNESSEKDKVTQASEKEVKGIENNNSAEQSEGEASENNSEDAEIEAATSEEMNAPEAISDETGSSVDPESESTSEEKEGPDDSAVASDATAESEAKTEAESEDKTEAESEETEEEEDHSDEQIELSGLTKVQLLKLLKDKIHRSPVLKLDKLAHEIKAVFDDLVAKEKEEAMSKFKAEGGNEDDFEYRQNDDERGFFKVFNDFRYQLNSLRKEAERQKEKNLAEKTELLNKLRELVDGEETTLSMGAIKSIQQQWKTKGPVPTAQNRNLWASFNALMDRFYDNRSIYFELKELDRKKNLESKTELCEKAELLRDVKELKEAIRQLNELHEEFKHIGPVPREDQENLWQRFKSASDAVYDRRKEFFDGQKEVFKTNQTEKERLIGLLASFADFRADRIKDWNTKTKEILEIQKNWEKVGPVP